MLLPTKDTIVTLYARLFDPTKQLLLFLIESLVGFRVLMMKTSMQLAQQLNASLDGSRKISGLLLGLINLILPSLLSFLWPS